MNSEWKFDILDLQKFGKGDKGCIVYKLEADRGTSWDVLKRILSTKNEPTFFVKGAEIMCCFDANPSPTTGSEEYKPSVYKVLSPWNIEFDSVRS